MTGPVPMRLLRDAGLRVTRQRAVVLERLVGRDRPITALALHAELKETGIGLTTVYRALHALAAAGMLHVFDSHGDVAYRLCGQGHHHHLVCRVCGSVAEGPPIPDLDRQLTRLGTHHGFTPERHRIEVYGICADCLPAM